jgi:hypothetical protein
MCFIRRIAYQLAQRREIENSFPKPLRRLKKTSELLSSTAFSFVSENMKIFYMKMLELEVLLQKQ